MFKIIIKNLLLIVLGTFFVVYGYRTFVVSKPCTSPMSYKIGTLDPHFGVSEEQFKKDIKHASDLWSTARGKELFAYDPEGSLTINLVYDTRQQITEKEKVLRTDISQNKTAASMAKDEYQAVETRYLQAVQSYKSQESDYTAAQNAYNTKIEYWNSKGGAPHSEYIALEVQKAELDTQLASLQVKREGVNELARQTNVSIKKYNALVDDINLQVKTINTDGLAGTQFEEGVYVSDRQGRRIDIYQFDNQTTFIRVLAHELGHALGLVHVTNATSVMSPVNQGTSLRLSAEDLLELGRACDLTK